MADQKADKTVHGEDNYKTEQKAQLLEQAAAQWQLFLCRSGGEDLGRKHCGGL